MVKLAIVTPSPIDIHVGARVRTRRNVLSMSQMELAKALGLTFQQIQKYERGTNRISASKLFQTAVALHVPVSYFFEGLVTGNPGDDLGEWPEESEADILPLTSEGMEMARTFSRIPNSAARRKLFQLAKLLAGKDDPEPG